MCLVVAAILVAAVALLGVQPDRTDELFAWTITPQMSPLYLASAYGAGAYFFTRGFFTRSWHHIAAGFPGIALFAILMLAATLLHWDKFNHGDAPTMASIAFYAWIIVYILSPFLVGGVWLRNRSVEDAGPDTLDAEVARTICRVAMGGGALLLASAAVCFAVPDIAIDIWPWRLTPLTSRIVAAFMAEMGAIAVALGLDARWSAWRTITQTAVIGGALLFSSVLRTWADFDTHNPLTWVFAGAAAGTSIGAAALHVAMQRQVARPSRSVLIRS